LRRSTAIEISVTKIVFYVKLALQKVSGPWRRTPGRPKRLKLAWLNTAAFSMSFNYVLPTTGAVSFTFFISSPPARLHGALAETGAQRGRLRDILKRLKRADDKDTLAVIKVLVCDILYSLIHQIIEDYLPYLFSVDYCLDRGIFMLDKEISTLTSMVNR
jgi:hypothetical protein